MTGLMKIVRIASNRLAAPRERRLHRKALLYWDSLRREREFPLLDEFDFLKLEDGFTQGLLLDLSDSCHPLLTHVGHVLREEAELAALPVMLNDVSPASLVGQFGRRWEQVLSERKPVESEYDFITEAGYHVYCRGVLLPLSTEGSSINQIYGVIGWKSEKVLGAGG
ncbi:MAG: hypothetical protein Q8R44_18825 [Novosphingobium sp.]|nr:hypothetical protein [Novosphingobium sp.]